MSFRTYPAYALWWLLSLLPLRALYLLSDCLLFPVLYHVVRYRRRLVRRQLNESLPELSAEERLATERKFYHTLCDYIVETLKMTTLSPEEMRRRVQFVGVDTMERKMKAEGKLLNLVCLGHFGNWEWLSSAALYMDLCAFSQVYHTLHSRVVDELFRHNRERFGGKCITMKETLRHIIGTMRRGEYEIVGLIADQCPKWEAMHQWCDFLHHETSFFIGAEAMGKRLGALVSYLEVTRPRRGYYRAELKLITDRPEAYGDYQITELYARMLEQSIRRDPHLWLWTHDRWKRTRKEWERRRAGFR
ncbi:MAG: lysophospholipid acyltransferase family protein [Prevotellaceae bacterium]|nr:lysophospholipid acyltransferase family protein [Prevotellaceae bacterium]